MDAVRFFNHLCARLNAVIIPAFPGGQGWDPFPFILLNLFLSSLAAFQAPIIMMSQNRQDARDRVVSDYVSKIILRNEHQTRHINAKVDHLLSFQWKRLLEIQEIQTVLLQIQRRAKISALPGISGKQIVTSNPKTSQYRTFEIVPDLFARLLLRHAFDCDLLDDTLIFTHWHEEGDNYTGTVDDVAMKFNILKVKTITFDILFNHRHATLDDILSGEGRIVLRNDFNLPHMNLMGIFIFFLTFIGQIPSIQLFQHDQPHTYFTSELPQRYKPAFALYVLFTS